MSANRTKPPKGYRVKLGAAMGHGLYNSSIEDTDGFRWSPECHSREEVIQKAWDHFDRKAEACAPPVLKGE